MERIQYRINTHNPGAEEGALNRCAYAIMGYTGRYDTWQTYGHYLPVKMEVLECTQCESKVELFDFVPLLPDEDNPEEYSEEFRLNWRSILSGEHPDWILVKANPLMTGVCLSYYSLKDKVVCSIYLDVVCSYIEDRPSNYSAKLYLKFSVPHADGRADTLYWLNIDYEEIGDYVMDNQVRLECFGCNIHRKMKFHHDDKSRHLLDLLRSGYIVDVIPGYADVVDYVDI